MQMEIKYFLENKLNKGNFERISKEKYNFHSNKMQCADEKNKGKGTRLFFLWSEGRWGWGILI